MNKDISEKTDSVHRAMSRYNLDNFKEIMDLSSEELDDEIDEEKLEDFQGDIDHYFSLYAPDCKEFKDFIEAISLYLVFIAKKPLHPPGIVFSDGTGVSKKDDVYFCTGKSFFIKEDRSLCKYCVCRCVLN